MPIPRPTNLSINEHGGVDCSVVLDGRRWSVRVTKEAILDLYGPQDDLIRAVRDSSEITRMVKKRLDVGESDEHGPITISSPIVLAYLVELRKKK